MGQLTITLSDDLEKEVREAVSKGDYGSVSDFIRDAIRLELSQKPRYWERAALVLSLENNLMLKKLVNEDEIENNELLDALRKGYSYDYYSIESIVAQDELDIEGARFVIDVLDMHASLQHATEVHNMSNEIKEEVVFRGFDGNAGDGYLGYTNFLVDNGRYTYVKPLDRVPHLNSHSIVNEIYERMLSAYKPIRKAKARDYAARNQVLSASEVKQIVDEQTHPENRR
jgi:uncharacterized protein YfbU (UPF0304 family)